MKCVKQGVCLASNAESATSRLEARWKRSPCTSCKATGRRDFLFWEVRHRTCAFGGEREKRIPYFCKERGVKETELLDIQSHQFQGQSICGVSFPRLRRSELMDRAAVTQIQYFFSRVGTLLLHSKGWAGAGACLGGSSCSS